MTAGRAATASGLCGDIADPVPLTVSVTADLRAAVALMLSQDQPLLPCLDENGKLRGVLSYSAVVRGLSAAPADKVMPPAAEIARMPSARQAALR